ncbi:ADP/ATP-dependent (S)-NAD(P)H-hydrate dehydratase [Salinibacterium sp. ZJ450]|uniref:ADP-dependent NAD(P)H-hydrate dehydratase n=1 Tax=Salinibacterium sp. ZJ450 TaxID=2708338 RepID=UPI0014227601|nr:ADP/ATP-dependent (S)-NAD(P)H-hydrate dehydratase [Salinibacterium sp. ZJ450]
MSEWTAADAAAHVRVPNAADDKYSRGVLGVLTGSDQYPGAAVLGVEAALRTGVGMLRYLGPERPTDLVLHRRPEVVTVAGRVQAWLLGSGMDVADGASGSRDRMRAALESGVPVVLDAGALELLPLATGPTIITPHAGELARLLGVRRDEVAGDPERWAREAAASLGTTVLLKGHTTRVVAPSVRANQRLAPDLSATSRAQTAGTGQTLYTVTAAPAWLATAGAGDALGGILGALVATHADLIEADDHALARLGATAALIHGLAATRASAGGPFTVLDLAAAIPVIIAELVAGR